MLLRPCTTLLLVTLTIAGPGAQQNQRKKGESPLRPIAPLDLPRTLDLYAGPLRRGRPQRGAGRRREPAAIFAGTGPSRGARGSMPSPTPTSGGSACSRRRRSRSRPKTFAPSAGTGASPDDPPCAAPCVLDWAHAQLVERGDPDRAERAWYLAAAALAGGVRDWRYLQRPVDPARPRRADAGPDGSRARRDSPTTPRCASSRRLPRRAGST